MWPWRTCVPWRSRRQRASASCAPARLCGWPAWGKAWPPSSAPWATGPPAASSRTGLSTSPPGAIRLSASSCRTCVDAAAPPRPRPLTSPPPPSWASGPTSTRARPSASWASPSAPWTRAWPTWATRSFCTVRCPPLGRCAGDSHRPLDVFRRPRHRVTQVGISAEAGDPGAGGQRQGGRLEPVASRSSRARPARGQATGAGRGVWPAWSTQRGRGCRAVGRNAQVSRPPRALARPQSLRLVHSARADASGGGGKLSRARTLQEDAWPPHCGAGLLRGRGGHAADATRFFRPESGVT